MPQQQQPIEIGPRWEQTDYSKSVHANFPHLTELVDGITRKTASPAHRQAELRKLAVRYNVSPAFILRIARWEDS